MSAAHDLGPLVRAVDQDADAVALRLLAKDEPAALALAQALERHLSAQPLARFERVWDLSSAQAAEIFGVSRQAYAKWHATGVPPARSADVADIDATTAALLAHVRLDVIPAVVRRAADSLGGDCLLGLARRDPRALRSAVASMFDLRRVQP